MKRATRANPVHHTQKIKARLHQLVEHLREDVEAISEPKAQALFETSAEVLLGLVHAFDDYERKNETAWQTNAAAGRKRIKSIKKWPAAHFGSVFRQSSAGAR